MAKHQARQAKQLRPRPAAARGAKDAYQPPGPLRPPRRATAPSGGHAGGAGGGDRRNPAKPVARGSAHAAAEKGTGGLDRVVERAKAGGGGRGSGAAEALRRGSRSAERRPRSPVPGEQRSSSPKRSRSTDGSTTRATRSSPTPTPAQLRSSRGSSPQRQRAGGAGGGADAARGGASRDQTPTQLRRGSSPQKQRAGGADQRASRSHPGKSYEREWAQVRGEARRTGKLRRSSAAASPVPTPAGQRRDSSVDSEDLARSHSGRSRSYEREWAQVRGEARRTGSRRRSSAAASPLPDVERRPSSVDAEDVELAC